MEASENFDDLVSLVQRLRKECPWDRKQTHDSIKDNLIEEAYEAVEAIDQRDFEDLKKELGDLLLHVIFQTTIASETGQFSIEDVIYTLQDKLIRRHPHVFEDVKVESEEEVAENWESIKMQEGKESVLDGIPKPLPALIRAQRMQEKAANIGFDWPESDEAWNKFEEEISEFKSALKNHSVTNAQQELGDLLFSIVNIARHEGLNTEDSLRQTNRKFKKRFRYIEKKVDEQNRTVEDATLEEMDAMWEEAKTLENTNGN